MRAQFIYENINFERGKDPIKSMGAGLTKAIRNRISNFHDFSGFEYIYYDQEDKEIIVGYDGYKSEQHKVQRAAKDSFGEFLNGTADKSGQEEMAFGIKPKYADYFEKAFSANESLNFERGADPKSTMDIGIVKSSLWINNYQQYNDEAIIKYLENPWDWIGKNIWFRDIKEGSWGLDFIMRLDKIDGGMHHNVNYVRFKDKYYKMNPEKLNKKPVNESMDFERGVNPKEALDIGTGKMIPENWEHLTRDLYPYFMDYRKNGNILILDIEGKLDPDNIITIIDGYLGDWVELEKYHEIVYDEWAEELSGDYRYTYKIKPDFINIFSKALYDEMPY